LSPLSVTASLAAEPTEQPPVVLIHGAGASAPVWTYWQRQLSAHGWASHGIDLRGHGCSDPTDLSRTSIWDYVDDVINLCAQFTRPPVVMGWSMGGHLAILAAGKSECTACVAFDPGTPSSTIDDSIELDYGVRSPQDIGYSVDGDHTLLGPSMPGLNPEELRLAQSSLCDESLLMVSERLRGIVVEPLPCPLLEVVGGHDDYYPKDSSYADIGIAEDKIVVPTASHWGLVLDRRVLRQLVPQVLEWLATRKEKPA